MILKNGACFVEINSYLSDAWQFQINNCVQDYILYVTSFFSYYRHKIHWNSSINLIILWPVGVSLSERNQNIYLEL